MIFKKKTNNTTCVQCKEKFDAKYNFCPYCGNNHANQEDSNFGMLGKNDISDADFAKNLNMHNNLGFLSSIVQSMMKGMMRELDNPNLKQAPNAIKIKIALPQDKRLIKEAPKEVKHKTPTHEQLAKFAQLPKTQAKTQVKRLNDKLLYELGIPGITSPEDILVSRLESGYEIKAIGEAELGERKVFVNSLPVTLPIKSFTINPTGLLIEFSAKEE